MDLLAERVLRSVLRGNGERPAWRVEMDREEEAVSRFAPKGSCPDEDGFFSQRYTFEEVKQTLEEVYGRKLSNFWVARWIKKEHTKMHKDNLRTYRFYKFTTEEGGTVFGMRRYISCIGDLR